MKQLEGIDQIIYSGLLNVNTGFDAPAVVHLKSKDMRKALKRMRENNCFDITIEAFASGKFEACVSDATHNLESWLDIMIAHASAKLTFNFTYSYYIE